MTDLSENKEDKKLGWMYRDASQIVDREEYLLGRKVDKQFETSVLPPGRDQECLPPSILSSCTRESQVDIARKLQEDPLYLIKKKEIECREQLLKNPRKMKQLQEMIAKQQAAAEKLLRKQVKKRQKKELDALLLKKCKQLFGENGTKKLAELDGSESNTSSSSGSDVGVSKKKKKRNEERKSLDRLLAIKYKKVVGNLDAKGLAEMDYTSEGSSEDERVNQSKRRNKRSPSAKKKPKKESAKDRKFSSSEDERNPGNKKEYGSRRQGRGSSLSEDTNNSNDNRLPRKGRAKERNYESRHSINPKRTYDKRNRNEREHLNSRSYSNKTSEKIKSSEREGANLKHQRTKQNREFGPDGVRYKVKDKSLSSSSDSSCCDKSNPSGNSTRKTKNEVKKYSHGDAFSGNSKSFAREKAKSKHTKASSTSSSSESSSEERRSQPKKQFGLVLPANYVPKKPLCEEIKPTTKKEVEPSKSYRKEDRHKLTDEEKERKLKEMMDNAKWRDERRDKNIKAFKAKEKAEKDDYVYNEDFMRKQMAIAVSQGTVESRVKANINTIQRSGSSMNEHFARRK